MPLRRRWTPSRAAAVICWAMWPPFRRSTLFSAITTGTPSANTREAMKRNPDIRDFYLGGHEGRDFQQIKHYRRRKRWLA